MGKGLIKKVILLFKSQSRPAMWDKDLIFLQENKLFFQKGAERALIEDLSEAELVDLKLSPDKSKIVFIFQKEEIYFLKIFSLAEKKLIQEKAMTNIAAIQLINWSEEGDKIYLAYKGEDQLWQISSWNDSGLLESILRGVRFDKKRLTLSARAIDHYLIFPVCEGNCHFSLYDIQKKEFEKEKIEIEEEVVGDELDFYYYDERTDRIVYQAPDKEFVFSLGFNGEVWHRIFLFSDPEKNIEFKGFNVEGPNFWLLAYSRQRKEAYLYDLVYFGLKIVSLEDEEELIHQENQFKEFIILKNQKTKEFFAENIKTGEKISLGTNFNYLKAF